MFTFLIVMASIMFYGAAMGTTFALAKNNMTRRCTVCIKGSSCRTDHAFVAGLFSVGWPFMMPFVIAATLADRDGRKRVHELMEMQSARRATELANEQARARRIENDALDRELATLERQQRVANLTKQKELF